MTLPRKVVLLRHSRERDDLAAPCTQRFEQADLCRALTDRDQHHVHDQRAGHRQADGGDARQYGADGREDDIKCRNHRVLGDDRDVFVALVARLDDAQNVALGRVHQIPAFGLYHDSKHAFGIEYLLGRSDRNDRQLIGIETK